MSTVRLSFSPAAAHVRTARLVGVAVARRAGVAEELLEEIRLAIGEACSRAVALHRSHGVDDLVDVAMDDGERFTVHVVDRAGNGVVPGASAGTDGVPPIAGRASGADVGIPPVNRGNLNAALADSLGEDAVVARMGLALLAGLVDDLTVTTVGDGLGTEISMSWPVEQRISGEWP